MGLDVAVLAVEPAIVICFRSCGDFLFPKRELGGVPSILLGGGIKGNWLPPAWVVIYSEFVAAPIPPTDPIDEVDEKWTACGGGGGL